MNQEEQKHFPRRCKVKLYNDNYANYKRYDIPCKAQLVIGDVPYQLGANAYGSNPMWYKGRDNKNGESKLAGKSFFRTDDIFKLPEFFNFCTRLLKKEPKKSKGRTNPQAPAMILFCAFQQAHMIEELGKRYGFQHSYPLFFIKKSSAQALKANMKIVGATEMAMVLYRDKLPKFNNTDADGVRHMVKNWFPWERDNPKIYPKIHPTQKPVNLLKQLIKIFTDPYDVVIDPCAGSGSTLRACMELRRTCYGFEVDKKFYRLAKEKMLVLPEDNEISLFGEAGAM
ncbi:MAG: site-specific DNA-methyltransferase [Selenomonas sp.]|uniref:DNA-methyltransferase n=1 Tax=Selenomonas sp. TaxID=2053611 RepID=UPI0025D88645|nr:site-specific DNA-methyltransferase [Selenomonas sp.]MCI6232293.1 site-specific DNA-methyltransferase [Selenomonas sp.]